MHTVSRNFAYSGSARTKSSRKEIAMASHTTLAMTSLRPRKLVSGVLGRSAFSAICDLEVEVVIRPLPAASQATGFSVYAILLSHYHIGVLKSLRRAPLIYHSDNFQISVCTVPASTPISA